MKISFPGILLTVMLISLIRPVSAQPTPLSGIYSIGGTGTYSTISEAVNALVSGGISGPVIFNIQDGDYNEQVIIPGISGSSELNTITFQSESQNSSAVKIFHDNGYDNNYVIRINGADHITFRKLTFETVNSDYGRAIVLDSSASYNHFESNIFRVPDNVTVCTGCNAENSLVYSGGVFNNNFNSFSGNLFENSNYGIWSAYSKGLSISGNTFTDQMYSAIYVQYEDSVIIRNNVIYSITDYYDYFPVYGAGCSNYISFERNKIFAPNSPNGIYFVDTYGSESNYGVFANNFISIGGAASEYDLILFHLRYCGYINFIYNNLYLNSPPDYNSRTLQLTYTDHINIMNNIIDNSSDGYAYYVNYPAGIDTSDYNDFYSTGNFANWSGYVSTLQDLKSASGKDQNSVSINPHFISGSDLHISDAGLNGMATPVPFITEDIDGDPRDPANPDIGADEFDPPSIDAGLAILVNPSPPFASGSNDVSVRLINSGLDPLTSARINWSVNGVIQTLYNWTGNLASGETEDIILGSYNFERNQSYNIKCWSSLPNGIADPFHSNDTIQVSNLIPALSGIYTIGGTSPDFATIQEAITAVYSLHLAGDVVLKLRDGTYNEQIYMDAGIGTSPQATITFESESGDSTGVNIAYNSSYTYGNYTVQLWGADYITFNKLTISALNNGYGRVIELRSGSDHNAFTNCVIQGVAANSSSENLVVVYSSAGTMDNYNRFSRNRILNGSIGITLSSDYNGNEKGNIIQNNSFENQYSSGIQVYYQDSLFINNNSFLNNSGFTSFSAIMLLYCKVHLYIEKNRIYIPNGGVGIHLYTCRGNNSDPGLIANNFITVGGAGGSAGIHLEYADYQRIYNNNINMLNSAGTGSSCIRINTENTSTADVRNNVLMNNGGGYCFNVFNPPDIAISDYNNLYTTGQYIAVWASYIGSLSDLQTASGKDLHSVSVDPKYISDTDLHVRDAALNNTGTPLSAVTDDIDGQPRNALKPDIGADEFSPYAIDAGLYEFTHPAMPFPSGTNIVTLIVKNYGGNTLESVAIDWMVNNIPQTRYNWTGSLVSGDTVSVDFGTYDFGLLTNYSIRAWTVLPNGQPDQNNENDSLQVSDLFAGMSGAYTIGGSSPDFQNFTEAANSLNLGGVTGSVTFNVRPGTYVEQFSLGRIPGASKLNSIKFTSESSDSSSVILTFNANAANNYTVQLNGTEYVTFDRLTIRGINTAAYGTVVNITNNASHVTFSGCILGNNAVNAPLVSTTNSISDYLTFQDNRFENGSFGIVFSLQGKGSRIENNRFINQLNYGMHMTSQDSLVIVKNSFSCGLNQINAKALYLSKCFTTRVEKNQFILPGGGFGIALYQCYGPTLIANNFIQVGGSAARSGILSDFSNKLDIYHNSINITNTSVNSCAFKISDYGNYSGAVNLKNNILVNTGGGYTIYTAYPNIITKSDFNDLYATGPNLAYWGANRANLTELRLASLKDSSSISIDPLFVSETDLHVQETALNNTGTPLSVVTDDIDGEYRDPNHPDIGADEFLNATHDMSVTGLLPISGCQLTSNETITLTIKNVGGFDETGFNVAYVIGNNLPVVETITQTIPEGGTLNYSFSKKADLSAIKSYLFRAYTALPGDQSRQNDTLETYVSNMPKLDVHLTGDTGICAGNAIRLSASGADTYSWSTGSTASAIYVNPASTTTYTIYARNLFNCQAWDTVTVRVNPIPPAPVITPSGPTNFCNDSSVMLTSSIDHNITWSNGEKTPSITVSHSGNFYVQYTDTAGCWSRSAVLTLTEEPAPVLVPADTTICSSDDIILTVNNAAQYAWSTGAGTKSITVHPAETTGYSVTATTPLGCQVSLATTIHVFPSKTPGLVSDIIPANGATGLSLPLGLSWMPAENTTYYDVYIWPENQTMPDEPFASNVEGIRYELNETALDYGTTYKWQVVAKYYGCESTPGPVQTMMIRHLPDLVVSNVQIPSNAFTGQEIEITWDITNQGLGNTGNASWTDNLSLSLDSTSRDGFHSLGNVNNLTYLEPGQGYSKKSTFKLPELKDGLFSIYAWTDIYNRLLETDNSNNQGRADHNILVKLAPVPDLFVSTILAPSDFFSEDTINLTWTVVNKGNWRTEAKSWTDRVWFSKDYNSSKRYFLGDFAHTGDSLRPGGSYTTIRPVVIPEGIFGRYYFYVETDAKNNVQEHALDGNNLTQGDSVNVILRPPADLEVSDIIIPKSAINSGTATIRWRLRNIGNSSPSDKYRTDAIFLSLLPEFNPGKAIGFYFNRNTPNGIPIDYEYIFSDIINIPRDIQAGDYYVFVYADKSDNVFEYTFNENNLLRSDTTMKITIAPWPDLTVTEFTHPDSAGAGETIPISYTVRNRGTATAKGGWTDRLYIIDANNLLFIKDFKRYDKLDIDSSYRVTSEAILPSGFNYGSNTYRIVMYTDYLNSVYEHSDEKNNNMTNDIFIKPSDLTVTALDIPPVILSGSVISAGWTVRNEADASTAAVKWFDRFEILDSANHSITPLDWNLFGKFGPVKAGDFYSYTAKIQIPDGISGNYYVRVKSDQYNENRERIIGNNVKTVPVKIELRQPTDLVVNVLTVPANGIAGQPVTISWEVKNMGTGSTNAPYWTDYLYLSQDTVIDDRDIILGTYPYRNGLNGGASYTVSNLVYLPAANLGNYYIIAQADFSTIQNPYGREFEYNAENNNTTFSLITIDLAPPSDLIVTGITAPASAITGEPVTIGWTIKNLGPNKAKGYLTDMVYFSSDTEWDIEDHLFGEKPVQINLDPDQSVTFSLTANLTGTSVGNYHVIVRTDNKNNINEVTDLNNTLASTSQVSVQVPLLPLNVQVSRTLFNDRGIFYRIEIPDTLVDETLLVTLKGDSVSGVNELFLSYDQVPDRSDYDFRSAVPFYGNQEAIIPSLQKGTYYLLVYGNVTTGTQQDITIFASKINFQVRSVDTNEGGNRGKVTTEIYGAKFSPEMKWLLMNASGVIPADRMLFMDATRAFVTFNLMNASLGTYDVVAINEKGDTAVLKNGFKVVENSPFGLVISVKAPLKVAVNSTIAFPIQYTNDGNVDIPVPGFKLISENYVPIALMKVDLEKNQYELEFELREIGGPQDILRPGAINSLYIWIQSGLAIKEAHFRFE